MILPLIYLSVFVLCFVLAHNVYSELICYDYNRDYNRRPRLLKFGIFVSLCSMAVLLLAIDVLNMYERLNWLSIKLNLL